MHRTTIFGAKIDIKKSKGAYLYDANRGKFFLDFFGMYSSLTLGYNHPILLAKNYQSEVLEAATVKLTNCEFENDLSNQFYKEFVSHSSMSGYQNFHFACTGALAIEAALKIAYAHRMPSGDPKVITFCKNFHGINSHGLFVTDRFGTVSRRLSGYPEISNVLRFPSPGACEEVNYKVVLDNITERIEADKGGSIFAILIEPILCTAGDLVIDPEFLIGLRRIATEYDIPLIFDEVQTGFGVTGEIWYFERLNCVPDIVVFGKKVQVSGVMVKKRFSSLFKTPLHLEVTWDGDLLDMIRSKYILRAFQNLRILDNVRKMGARIGDALKEMDIFSAVRQNGLLLAVDFENQSQRDRFFKGLYERDMLVNSTQATTIRFRPHLAIDNDSVSDALDRIRDCARVCF